MATDYCGGTILVSGVGATRTVRGLRAYAQAHLLNLRSVLHAALADYAARRQQTDTGPEPQLHFRRGHPSAEVTRHQRELLAGSTRCRRLR